MWDVCIRYCIPQVWLFSTEFVFYFGCLRSIFQVLKKWTFIKKLLLCNKKYVEEIIKMLAGFRNREDFFCFATYKEAKTNNAKYQECRERHKMCFLMHAWPSAASVWTGSENHSNQKPKYFQIRSCSRQTCPSKKNLKNNITAKLKTGVGLFTEWLSFMTILHKIIIMRCHWFYTHGSFRNGTWFDDYDNNNFERM